MLAYPPSVRQQGGQGITVGARYERRWQDGIGARSWKLNHTLGGPVIIASTRETGDKIPSSVFVHDVLDHLPSGFAPSGHLAEAMALAQLGERTDSDIRGAQTWDARPSRTVTDICSTYSHRAHSAPRPSGQAWK